MNIRVRAAVKTLGILGLAIGGLVYLMYTIVLGRLQSQEILDKMNSKG